MAERLGPLLVIAGPTATGKTAAAVALAKHFDGELIGADSVQVYRDFDIGSAKPGPDELGPVAHHLIDVVNPDRATGRATGESARERACSSRCPRAAVTMCIA